jgi:hypothetical protein
MPQERLGFVPKKLLKPFPGLAVALIPSVLGSENAFFGS